MARMNAPIPPSPTGAGYYRPHVFFCLNERANGEDLFGLHGAKEGVDYCKRAVQAAGLAGPGQVRVNKAGCLDRCSAAPVVVVYPEAVWYTFIDESDIDEIIESHLKHGKVVERLRIPAHMGR